jgi:sirohydrochlorin cobaltochelatase
MNTHRAYLAAAIACIACLLTLAATGAEEHTGHGDDGHQMTAEQLAELRVKIPLYDIYSDEQIMGAMARMKNLWGWMGESGTREGSVGILGLAHGFKEPGNTQFRAAYSGVGATYPATYAVGMAMMTSDHIQSAVSALEQGGAGTIIVIPTTTADHSTLTRQWDYIFSRRDDSAYLDVPRVETSARLVWADTPTANPIVAEIMLDYALELSKNPASETVIILGHGPQSADDNAKELAILERHADYIKQTGGFGNVIFGNVQDDAPPEVRASNVVNLRAAAQQAIDDGHAVIAVHTSLTQSGIVKRLNKDIGDLASFNGKGLMEHPRFADWIDEVVAANLN